MSTNTFDLHVFVTDAQTGNESPLPSSNCGRNVTSNVAPWFGLISSNMWEAVLMFVAYLATRWFQNLRSTAIFLQVYVLAVIARETIVDFGRVVLRAIWWLRLAKHSRLKLPWTIAHQSASELAGFLLLAAALPFLPIYPVALALFVGFALLRKTRVWDDPLPKFWQKLGYCIYDVFLTRYLRAHDEEAMQRKHRRKQSVEERFSSNPESPNYFLDWRRKLIRHYRNLRSHSCQKPIFYAMCFLLMLPISFFTLSSVHFLTFTAFEIAVLGVCAVFLVCALICFVVLIGGHVTIALAIGLEIVTSILGIDLETDTHELRIWACFSIPLIILFHKFLTERLIAATLSALKHDLGPQHRLSRMCEIYFQIPLDGAQAAIKISDCLTGNLSRPSNRHPKFLVMSLQGGHERQIWEDSVESTVVETSTESVATLEVSQRLFSKNLKDMKTTVTNDADCMV